MIELDTFASSQLSIIFLIGTFPCKSYNQNYIYYFSYLITFTQI